LREAFGEIQLVEREGAICAAFEDTSERLLVAVGGRAVSGWGCGGRQPDLSTGWASRPMIGAGGQRGLLDPA